MLDKNPEQITDNSLAHIQKKIADNALSIILYSEPFHKMEFLCMLINYLDDPIIFVDMDLLYTGYVESGMIQRGGNVSICNPSNEDWEKELSEIIVKASKERFTVIIDSFNGLYNIFNDLESARFINSCIMLLAHLGCHANSSVIITGMAKKKDNGEWILSPGGRQITRSAKTKVYLLKKIRKDLTINTLDETEGFT